MKKRLLSLKFFILLCILAILLFLVLWTIWGNKALMINKISISSSRIPTSFSNFRIAQISDLHNAEFGEKNSKLLTKLSANKPDIIVLTGDLVDARHTDIDIAIDFAKEAIQIAPIYYVNGNHEARLLQYAELKNGLEEIGVVILEDKAIQLENDGDKITLVGLSDPDFAIGDDLLGETSAMINSKLKNLIGNENNYTILLSHRPELFKTYVNCNIDMVLTGHAHGGQFRLPFVGGLIAPNQGLFPKYDAGLYTEGNTNMIVSRGIGNSIIPFRFNNRPEIVLVEFKTE